MRRTRIFWYSDVLNEVCFTQPGKLLYHYAAILGMISNLLSRPRVIVQVAEVIVMAHHHRDEAHRTQQPMTFDTDDERCRPSENTKYNVLNVIIALLKSRNEIYDNECDC